MRKPCHTDNCPMNSDPDYDGDSSVDSDGVDWYCSSCEAIQAYYDSVGEAEESEDD